MDDALKYTKKKKDVSSCLPIRYKYNSNEIIVVTMDLLDNDRKKKYLEIKDLHLSNKDDEAFSILEDFVQELNLINFKSNLDLEHKLLTALIRSILPLDKFYLLAGDIYTNVGEFAKSLEAYKMYHFWVQQIMPHKSLMNRNNVRINHSSKSYDLDIEGI